MCFFARYLERYVFFARYLERYVFFCQISGKICVLSSVVRTLAGIVWSPFVAKTR